MDDLISRQAAIYAIKGLLDSMLETDTIGFYEIENVLFEVPSAQPEIIRCKECRHNDCCSIQEAAMAGDSFFCGAAERRTDE